MREKQLSHILTAACLVVLIAVLPACKYFKKNSPVQGESVIARVNDDYLYLSDLSPLIKNVPPHDSASFIANYAESWARRRLLLKKAEENVPADELGLDKKVEDYRQSLLLYEYEKGLINQKLDKAVSDAEINDFYEKNKEKFTLESDIYDVQYVQIRSDAEEIKKMLPLITSPKNEEEIQKREGYCKAVAKTYSFAENNWMNSSAILKQFPISQIDVQTLAANGKFAEFTKEADSYFVHIVTIKHQGEPSPLSFIKNQIKEVFINKKKVILIQKIYDKIYEDGMKSGNCEVLVKK
jgi:hypothetical protein